MTRIILIAFGIATLLGCAQSDKKVKLEKILFHTSMCFGTCPTYHLQVDNNRDVKLYAEQVYKTTKDIVSYDSDTGKMGYFIGKISDTNFNQLTNELNNIGLDTIKFDGNDCCDGSLITIIVYYNGKRKLLKTMFPPEKSHKLIGTLYNICNSSTLKRTSKEFIIENEHTNR